MITPAIRRARCLALGILSVLALLAPSHADAQQAPLPDCASVQQQQSMNQCFSEQARRSVARLDTLVSVARASGRFGAHTDCVTLGSAHFSPGRALTRRRSAAGAPSRP
jgi:hypothetical protein